MPTFEMLDGPMESVERELNIDPWVAGEPFYIDDGTRRHWYCTAGANFLTARYSHSEERPPGDPRENVKPLRTVGELKTTLDQFPSGMPLAATWEGITAVVHVYGGECPRLFPLDEEFNEPQCNDTTRVPHCFIDADGASYREKWQK